MPAAIVPEAGANPKRRQLTPEEAQRFSLKNFLPGDDQGDPTKVR
jgi:hypothetical protein